MKRWILLCLAALGGLAACETILGFEDHELYPPDASVSGQGGAAEAAAGASAGGAGGAAGSTGGSAGVSDAGDAADTGPGRVTDGLVALYTFDEGTGTTVKDTSGVAPALDLTIDVASSVQWKTGFLHVLAPVRIRSFVAAQKVFDRCTASGEITAEAWLRLDSVVDTSDGAFTPNRIVTMSIDGSNRNFTLGHDEDRWVFRVRRTGDASGFNGTPGLQTPSGTATLNLAHVVATRAASGLTTAYRDGTEIETQNQIGDFSNWDPAYELTLANELADDRDWLGELHLVAIYDKALSPAEIQQNLGAGPN